MWFSWWHHNWNQKQLFIQRLKFLLKQGQLLLGMEIWLKSRTIIANRYFKRLSWKKNYFFLNKKESLFEPYSHTQHDLNNTILHRTHTQYKTILIFIHSGSTKPLPPFPTYHAILAYGSRHQRPQDIRKQHQPMVPPNFIPKTFKLLALHEEIWISLVEIFEYLWLKFMSDSVSKSH